MQDAILIHEPSGASARRGGPEGRKVPAIRAVGEVRS